MCKMHHNLKFLRAVMYIVEQRSLLAKTVTDCSLRSGGTSSSYTQRKQAFGLDPHLNLMHVLNLNKHLNKQ